MSAQPRAYPNPYSGSDASARDCPLRWRSYCHPGPETSPAKTGSAAMRDGVGDLPYSVWITVEFGYDAELFE